MDLPTKIRPTKRLVSEKQEERETWYKLYVKIVSWKDGLLEGGSVKRTDKISKKEWDTYCFHMLKINVTHGREKTLQVLEEVKKSIKSYGGFEK